MPLEEGNDLRLKNYKLYINEFKTYNFYIKLLLNITTIPKTLLPYRKRYYHTQNITTIPKTYNISNSIFF